GERDDGNHRQPDHGRRRRLALVAADTQSTVRGCYEDSPTPGPQTAGEYDEGKPMNSQQPNPVAAAAARSRGRVRVRAITAGIGAAGLVVAGVVAYALPGSSQASTTGSSGSAASSGAGTSSGSSSSAGSDDGLGASASSGSSDNSGFSG